MNELFQKPEKVKRIYLSWLNDKIKSKKSYNEDVIEIQTPFLNQFNDWIYIYLIKKDNSLILSDGGSTLNELALSGVKISTNSRKEILNRFLLSNGLCLENEEIFKKTNLNTLAKDKHFLIQGILSINDMFILNKGNIKSLFLEDVKKYFDEIYVRYSTDIGLVGKSGLQHNFNFLIPKSKNLNERVIHTINNLDSKDKVESALIKFIDIQDVRQETIGVVIINDTERQIKSDFVDAFSNYNIKPILFSEIGDYKEFLVN